jgi:hypothetical protein
VSDADLATTGANTFTGAQTVGLSALGTTPTAALSLTNSTAAAVGAQQVSPSLVLEGQGWKTTATAASQTVRFRQNVLPVQGTTNPSATWRLQSEINNSGTFQDVISVTSGGQINNVFALQTQNGHGIVSSTGGLMVAGAIIPGTFFQGGADNVNDIGNVGNRFRTLRLGTNAIIDGAITLGTDVILGRHDAASLQLGANTATASATATGQTLKGPNATGTTSTGGSLTLAGGTGTSAGGAVIISTAATTTQTERARFSSAGVTIGASGTAIASVISATATLDFPSTNEHECSAANITVTGAAVGDVVALGIPTEAIGTSGVFFGYVSAADTVTVRYHNTDKNSAVNPASGTFRATVIKH